MRITLSRTLFFVAMLTVGLLVPGCYYGFVASGPAVPMGGADTYYVDEGHHGALHDYYYYPGAGVYFDPIAISWYWHEGGGWHHGRDLPHHYRINERDRVSFHTDARHPYDMHDRVQRRANEHRGYEERHH